MLEVRALSKRFGGLLAVDRVMLQVDRGEIVGLIGPNGAGKTTLFSMIAGFQAPSGGQVWLEDRDITGLPAHHLAARGIARTFQIVQPFPGLTVLENIAVGAHLRHPHRAEALDRATQVASRVGLAGQLQAPAERLTVAARKRLELARALATEPRLLLLDEVLAGLNPSEIRDILPLLREIRDQGVTILMIEHVMQAVMNLCHRAYVLNNGAIIAEGSPTQVTNNPAVIEAYLGPGAAARLRGAHHA